MGKLKDIIKYITLVILASCVVVIGVFCVLSSLNENRYRSIYLLSCPTYIKLCIEDSKFDISNKTQAKEQIDKLFQDKYKDAFNSNYTLENGTIIVFADGNTTTYKYEYTQVPTWNIYIKETLGIESFCWTLTHELMHCMHPSLTDKDIQGETFKLLYNSNNNSLRHIAIQQGKDTLTGKGNSGSYNFAKYVVEETI